MDWIWIDVQSIKFNPQTPLIKTDVQACCPSTLSAAIRLARLYESSNLNNRPTSNNEIRWPTFNTVTVPSQNYSPMIVKRLKATELKERKGKGLYFNCNEKFSPSYRRKSYFLLKDPKAIMSQNEEAIEISLGRLSFLSTSIAPNLDFSFDSQKKVFEPAALHRSKSTCLDWLTSWICQGRQLSLEHYQKSLFTLFMDLGPLKP